MSSPSKHKSHRYTPMGLVVLIVVFGLLFHLTKITILEAAVDTILVVLLSCSIGLAPVISKIAPKGQSCTVSRNDFPGTFASAGNAVADRRSIYNLQFEICNA